MRKKVSSMFVLLALLVMAVTTAAYAQGNSPAQLSSAGWLCMNVPGLGVHCFGPGAFRSTASVPVKVFDTIFPTSTDAPFLGTEILIRADLYAGQLCTQDGGGEYHLLEASESPFPVDYRACHFYDTSP